jgi:glycosyltransferase involved in cell wall biosynthesis
MNAEYNPLVSIITPFLNAENFLKETVECVLQQEYTNWELLLIDDGSTDNSTDIAKEYSLKYPGKVFYYEHEGHVNKAAAASRNLGLKHANGELIALLDADDIWLPKKLKQQVTIFEKYPEVGMLCEASKYWYSWDGDIKNDKIIRVGATENIIYKPPLLLKILYPLGKGDAPCPSSIMLKTSTANAIGGFEEAFIGNYQVYEDQAFLSKIYLQANVYISSECQNWYRNRQGSVMATMHQQGQYNTARYFFLQWLQKYLKQNNIQDREINTLLSNAMKPYKYPHLNQLTSRLSSFLKRILNIKQ